MSHGREPRPTASPLIARQAPHTWTSSAIPHMTATPTNTSTRADGVAQVPPVSAVIEVTVTAAPAGAV